MTDIGYNDHITETDTKMEQCPRCYGSVEVNTCMDRCKNCGLKIRDCSDLA